MDLVTLSLLCVLVMCGILTAEQAFASFGDRVIVLLAAIFVIGSALRETGVCRHHGQCAGQYLGHQAAQIDGHADGRCRSYLRIHE